MRILRAAAVVAVVTSSASAGQMVTLCVDPSSYGHEVRNAEGLATKVFAKVGVKIEWRDGSSCSEIRTAILVGLSDKTPDNLLPGALAYALPYQGNQIVVFYDRVRKADPALVTPKLAYVLIHEITHILEGIVRHSEGGVMKARWGREDNFEIATGRLTFSPEDVDLIRRGLNARATAHRPAFDRATGD